ncbi:hypothetical protein BKA82DRAFT_35955 [Pisolithus tinctorius]|uniref:Uncharacterized protein n=1 Tax=Pisolithus tinctorius Marx 270 TaxID=870435 RepID=A0A0C3I906_PISTI|nr:hypothetical protein BKA82DRAFT_35955 [Pisolithus tinctorius]KIN93597.1 hypothetical protein M404DRAFT_35955 [Pisolithus tinctorius Marx 270]
MPAVAGCMGLPFSLAQKHRMNCLSPSTTHSFATPNGNFILHGQVGRKTRTPPVSLQKITISIWNKLRYLQGALSVAMQEIPSDLEELLADENKNQEERDKERGTAFAGESRSDRCIARYEYFGGDNDVDHDGCAPPSATRRNPISLRTRKPRARRTRGRARGRASGANGRVDGEEVDESSSVKLAKTRSRIRSRAKPRGRIEKKVKVKGVEDIDADVGGEPESGVEPATLVDVALTYSISCM